MADTLQFTKPKDIEIYGSMIAIFARAAKKMGRWASKPTDITIYPINDIVGAGKWNSLNASETDFVINGPTEIAKARTDKSGLFGALPIIHEPQRSLSLQAPTLLGRAGCKLRATIENKTITIPLQDVSFGFLVREGNRPGKIVIRKSIGGFKKGTVLMNGRNWVRKFGESVVDRYDESGMPIKQEGEPDFRYDASYRPIDRDGKPLLDERYKPLKPDGEPLFNIIDSRERLLQEEASALMLWGHISAMRFKQYGKDTPEYKTIERDGIGGEFEAQRAMIEWLKLVYNHNGINLMPIFKEYVQEARDQLLAEPELLHEMARASIFFKQMKKLMEDNGIPERWPNYMCDPELEEQFDQALWNVSFFEASIEWIASGLGLTLPMANIPQDNIVPPTARAFIANMATILSAARASRVTP